jgi:hypothetical protein
MKYKIYYYFDGNGCAEIEAENKDEAKNLFYEGDYKPLYEYEIGTIEKVKKDKFKVVDLHSEDCKYPF